MTLIAKRALVTGSTSGIGLGIARALAASGTDVMLNGFGDPNTIDRLRSELATEFGVRVEFDGADLSDAGEVSGLVGRTQEQLGSIDILVNNAGIQHVDSIEVFPNDKWNEIIALNLSAAFHTMKAVIPPMRARGWGRIINVASAHGLVASAGKIAYVAAKHGLVGATKVAAIEVANDGITVNAICPGWVLTPLVQHQLEDRARENGTDIEIESAKLLSEKQPMLQFTSPESIGAMTVFLCSEAAKTITGTPLSIDGGWLAQ